MAAAIAIVVLSVFLAGALLVLRMIGRQISDICRQLQFLREEDSNLLLTRQLDWFGIGRMADILNEMILQEREEKRQWRKKEQLIADTYTNLSHDIRTPLTSLDGYFQLLEESENISDRKRYIEVIQERIKSLKEMLEELFIFTRLKNGNYELSLSCCNLTRLVKGVLFSYYEEWTKRGIRPEFTLPEERMDIWASEQAVCRVLQNIIKNALDHGESCFRLSLQSETGQAVLRIGNRVRDPEAVDPEQVFERFYKSDIARSKTSTGLGLSIAREFVLRMEGEIFAELQEDEFMLTVKFPLQDTK